jgi:hypothetical protein
MTKERMMAAVAGVLMAAAASPGDLPVPLGPMYMAFAEKGWTFEDFNALTFVVCEMGLAEVTTETLELTSKGRALAARLEERLS